RDLDFMLGISLRVSSRSADSRDAIQLADAVSAHAGDLARNRFVRRPGVDLAGGARDAASRVDHSPHVRRADLDDLDLRARLFEPRARPAPMASDHRRARPSDAVLADLSE